MLKPVLLLLLSGVLVASLEITIRAVYPDCPFPDPGGESVYFPHETDCSLFYECSNGEPILLECPGDLVFNPDKNVCDKRENTNCQDAKL
ncbi:hypothetical protein FQA39_LY04172 [Lamprigera yunnana]|nr:hypothetical protein FQA39_LY04172 [Lamprigera yunnana]